MASQIIVRPLANFPSTVWKASTYVSLYSSDQKIESYGKEIEVLKEKVKNKLVASTENIVSNINFINLLCRLGVSYHFYNEIEEQLQIMFNAIQDGIGHDYDLHTTALIFQIFRQHGLKISCNVFQKFKNDEGKFKEEIAEDVKGILSLYEATFLSMHGDDILDEALLFARKHLECLDAESVSSHLAEHVKNTLSLPFHRGLPRIEVGKYISFYEQEESHDQTLLKFAKLDFNRLQLLYKQELGIISRWWRELDVAEKLPYARDRVVEGYFMGVGLQFEPEFAASRILLAKFIGVVALIDDTYDSYGTFEELKCFTNAIERGDIESTNELPDDNFKILYTATLKMIDEWAIINEERKEGGSFCLDHIKEKFKELVRSYHVETKWFYNRHVPSFDEYMQNALVSSACTMLAAVAAIGMGNIAGVNEFQWLQSNPKIVRCSEIFGRLINDMVAREDEEKEGHCLAGGCYMREYGVSKEKAVDELRKICDNTWKDINEEFIKPFPVSMPLLMTSINLARLMEVMYQNRDTFTHSSGLKDYMNLVILQPMPE